LSGEIIFIKDLRTRVHIGVTPRERKRKQRIDICVEMEPVTGWENRADSIENTVNYSSVRRSIRKLLGSERFNLIETAASRIALLIGDAFPVKTISVTIKKYPYRDTACVGCRFDLRPPEKP